MIEPRGGKSRAFEVAAAGGLDIRSGVLRLWKIRNDRRLVGVRESDLLRAAKLDRARTYHSVCTVQDTGKDQAANQEI